MKESTVIKNQVKEYCKINKIKPPAKFWKYITKLSKYTNPFRIAYSLDKERKSTIIVSTYETPVEIKVVLKVDKPIEELAECQT